ncbi:MAG TPA: hypothetical protein VGL08_15190 [Paraburkholderia sp.]
MKILNKTSRTLIATLLAGGALLGASSAFAQSVAVYDGAQLIPVGVSIDIGWHGDRYWDGHRYWAHDEWMHRHPHDHDPRHHDDHDDHHDHHG